MTTHVKSREGQSFTAFFVLIMVLYKTFTIFAPTQNDDVLCLRDVILSYGTELNGLLSVAHEE